MAIKSIRDLAIREKRVFIRTDFNVPMDKQGNITDTTRIEAAIPTIRYAVEHNARVIVASHFGRPDGQRKPEYTMEPVAAKLAELMGIEVTFFEDCIGMGPQQMVREIKPGQVLVLENLRFYPGEGDNDGAFAKDLAKLCDVYINDAFGVSHRKNASVHALPLLMETKGMGFLMEKEITELGKLVNFKHGDGFAAILGGAKVSDKIGIIRSLLDSADALLIGGAMACTFLAAKGITLGRSLVEKDKVTVAAEILKGAEARKVRLLLPEDHVAALSMDDTETQVFGNNDFPAEMIRFDIGPKTVKRYAAEVAKARTIFWNGPMGVFEKAPFAKGSVALAEAVGNSKAHTVTGGGDSVSMMNKAGIASKIGHISTGGGASLEFIQDKTLPGVEALKE
ncbi:MAG TPA: phosphoglycerate kinase [bacterium]|nr:phosphoglycerate kinase [bacterium]